MPRILIVCKANICRSPMAEALLHACFPRDGQSIASAGLAALRGFPIDPRAQRTLAARGLSAPEHVARQATKPLLLQSDLVLAMEQRQVAAVLALCPTLRGRVLMLSHWDDGSDIEDPYGREQQAFEDAFQRIESCIRQWQTKL
jgi:protein-tyrosine phosphatase